jgi:Uma2 family endonuclease
MSTIPAPATSSRRLLLRDIDWKTYNRLVWVFAERPQVRLTYDRGNLEIMSPLLEHETDADFLGQLVVALTEELGLPRKAGGASTLRRKRNRKGLEPDRCYWIAQEPAIRGKKRIDLRVDPPPDLAIEVDLTSSSLNRLNIYASLGVPEVWRLEGTTLTFHHLAAGVYSIAGASRTFPIVTPADLLVFLDLRTSLDENSVIQQFRAWLRGKIGSAAQP